MSNSWVSSHQHQSGRLLQSKHQIHVLHRLTRCAFYQIIDGGEDDQLAAAGGKPEVTEICSLDPIDIRRTFDQAHEKSVSIKIGEYRPGLAGTDLLLQFAVD